MLRIGSMIRITNVLYLADYKVFSVIGARHSLGIYGTFRAPLYRYGSHPLHSEGMPRLADPLGQ